MDVRCERCRAQYVFDDEQITPAGLTVQCTSCGHVFRVKKKELVVTVAVKPDEVDAAPVPASSLGRRPGAAAGEAAREPAREWHVRRAGGDLLTFREASTLQKWVVERKVGRDDALSQGGGQWRRLGDLPELASFFEVVEAAARGRAQTPPVFSPPPLPGALPPPPSGFPPPSFTMPLPAGRPPATAPPQGGPAPAAAPAGEESFEIDLAAEELAAVKRGGGKGLAVGLLVLLAAGGVAAAWALAPQLFRGKTAELAPPAVAAKPPEPAAPPPPAAVEPAPAPAPAPPPVVVPDPPRSTKALLAEAGRLRERGEVEKALDVYGAVASEDPDNVEALTGRGLCYLDLESYPPAEASFQAALELDPRQADALLGLAETYRWQGKKADAIRYYERYLAAHPGGDEAQVARNALEELRL
jgi:predicted Zn finger-like uncharacterized protein